MMTLTEQSADEALLLTLSNYWERAAVMARMTRRSGVIARMRGAAAPRTSIELKLSPALKDAVERAANNQGLCVRAYIVAVLEQATG